MTTLYDSPEFQFDANCQTWGMREDAVRNGIPVSNIGTCETYNMQNLPESQEAA